MGEGLEKLMPGQPVGEDAERRGGKRRALRRRVRVDPGAIQALTADISAGGAFVITGRPPELGSPVNLIFSAAHGELRVHGRVRWVRRALDPESPERAAGMGIEFVAPAEAAAEGP
ncbi:MAG: PilZ domain-containing protein [Deltaproteobacteria bacterium]|nr:PilZ domain-containing protein [Deltaproteobacteria bacterium]